MDELFLRWLSVRYKIIEKYLKKVLVSLGKGSTFAPAFGTEEGMDEGTTGAEVL